MVNAAAEAVPEVAVETVLGDVPETPESIPEPVAAEPEEDFTSLLGELIPATEEATDVPAPADKPADVLKDKTPEQLLDMGEQRAIAKLSQQSEVVNQRNRENGLRNVLATSKNAVQAELSQAGVDTDTALRILAKFDQFHGTHLELKDADINNASAATVAAMRQALIEEGVKRTGNKDFEAAAIPEYIDTLLAHEIKAKGYQTKAEVTEAVKQGQIALIKRYKELGIDPTGRVPNVPAARGVSGAQPKDYAEAEAWHASDKWTNAQFNQYRATHSRT